jgi:hypothetical protein
MSLRRRMGWICVLLTAGLILVGLWPFSFRPANQVRWLPDREGLEFGHEGIAYDPGPLPAMAPGQTSHSPEGYTIQLWLRPGLVRPDDVFDILTIDDGGKVPNLVLCQWLNNLELRVRANDVRRGYHEVGGDGMLLPNTERVITVTADAVETIFYADGGQVARFPRPMLPIGGLTGQLILGNSATGKHPWTGQLFGLAVFNRALTAAEVGQDCAIWTNHAAASLAGEKGLMALYLFDERRGSWAEDRSPNGRRIYIPATFKILHKQVLTPPWVDFQFDASELRDDLINVFGFLPYGFCVLLHRRMSVKESLLKGIWITVAVGGSVSLFIELVQVWLPDRYSSGTDLLFNILGTFLGALLARWLFAIPAGMAGRSPDSNGIKTTAD